MHRRGDKADVRKLKGCIHDPWGHERVVVNCVMCVYISCFAAWYNDGPYPHLCVRPPAAQFGGVAYVEHVCQAEDTKCAVSTVASVSCVLHTAYPFVSAPVDVAITVVGAAPSPA